LTRANANKGGQFINSYRSDEIINQARSAMAISPQEIVFGTNMIRDLQSQPLHRLYVPARRRNCVTDLTTT
jgi:hypothetical protein